MNLPLSSYAGALPNVDMDALLMPLPYGDGVGVPLRVEPVYQQIRDARRADDASVPMGEWERPLVKADWKTVAALSAEALATRSKDYQLAAWLCEAWTHLHHVDGLVAGMQLLGGLVDGFWAHAYPKLETGDSDARAAPFAWLGPTLALVLRLHVPLMKLSVEPGSVNLDDWLRLVARAGSETAEPAVLTRDLLDKEVTRGANLAALQQLEQRADEALEASAALMRRLDEKLGADAPSFSPIAATLRDLQRAARALRGSHAPPAANEAVPGAPAGFDIEVLPADGIVVEQPAIGLTAAALPAAGPIVDREHAYRLLEEIARYLAAQEPHSPTPYLLNRAVAWGRLPLPDLMREIVRQEGDLSRYLTMLGLE